MASSRGIYSFCRRLTKPPRAGYQRILVRPLQPGCWLFILFGTAAFLDLSIYSELGSYNLQEGLFLEINDTPIAPKENTTIRSIKDIDHFIKISSQENHGKEPILLLLKNNAGLSDISEEIYQQLPTWNQVTSLYGSTSRTIGLDQCETFQKHLNETEGDHKGLAVAGMFNSGSNFLNIMIASNCDIQFAGSKGRKRYLGIYSKTPWGKHNPPNISTMKDDPRQILPVVSVRDPYRWMQSMCKASYAADWPLNRQRKGHVESIHCPALVPMDREKELLHAAGKEPLVANGTEHHFPVKVTYSKSQVLKHNSLAHLWNDWYRGYLDLSNKEDYPRILVRYEDLIFFPDQVIPRLCSCAGGRMIAHNRDGHAKIIISSAKDGMGPKQTNYLEAIIKYGSEELKRHAGMTAADLEYAQEHLDSAMMEMFHYPTSTI